MSLFKLPTELRHEIYSYLTSGSKIDPFGGRSIMKISHRPPPSALQRTCRFLCDDTTAYFYSIATIYIGYYATSILNEPSALAVLRRVNKVNFAVIWRDYEVLRGPVVDTHVHYLAVMSHDLDVIRLLNSEVKCLEKLTVRIWRSCESDIAWEMREERLAQLEEVKEGVMIVVGNFSTYQDTPDDEARCIVENYVKMLNAKRA